MTRAHRKRKSETGQSIARVLGAWSQRHEEIPHVLYHYTSADGLIGILTTKTIWLTDLRYMNDLSELQYSRELVAKSFESRAADSGLSETERDFIKRIRSTFDPLGRLLSFLRILLRKRKPSKSVAGISRQRWRVCDRVRFFHLLRLMSRPCVLRKVVYEQDEQMRLVDFVVDEFLAAIRTEIEAPNGQLVGNTFLTELCQAFRSVMGELLFCFKHPDFKEELEWRLAHFSRY